MGGTRLMLRLPAVIEVLPLIGVEIRMLSNPMVALAMLVYHRLSK